jgi:hypothetical protein
MGGTQLGFSDYELTTALTSTKGEVGAFYWTVPAPDIVNSGREEQGSFSV